MKKKIMILVLTAILTVGGASFAYAASNNGAVSNSFNRPMMSAQNDNLESSADYRGTMMERTGSEEQSNDSYNKMIEKMKNNGLTDEAAAMENGDFNTMQNLMSNMSTEDYKKMIDVMRNNGYESMANKMESVGKDNMVKIHQNMMGR